MFDPNYDPYERLEYCVQSLEQQRANMVQIAHAFNDISEQMKIMAEQHQQLTAIIRRQESQIRLLIAQSAVK